MLAESPISDVALSFLRNDYLERTFDSFEAIYQTLLDFLNSRIDYEEAQKIFKQKGSPTSALDKVHKIKLLASGNTDPLPPVDDEFPEKSDSGRRKARLWTPEENRRLLAAIHKFGLERWIDIVKFVGASRTRPQCTQRWNRGLDPRISKENWTEIENKRLFKLVEEFGVTAWSKIAKQLGNRSDVQCRYHYNQLISKQKTRDRETTAKNPPFPKVKPSIVLPFPLPAQTPPSKIDPSFFDFGLDDSDFDWSSIFEI